MTVKNDVPFSVTVGGSALPEHMQISFETSGFEGGNGSAHELTLTWGAGEYEPEVFPSDTGLRLKMRGDWELEGMLDALIALGDHLRIYRKNSGRALAENPVDL